MNVHETLSTVQSLLMACDDDDDDDHDAIGRLEALEERLIQRVDENEPIPKWCPLPEADQTKEE